MVEDLSGIAVDVEYANEYWYRSEKAMTNAAMMVVSQFGETADTLAALRKANLGRHETLAITNVDDFTMVRGRRSHSLPSPGASGPSQQLKASGRSC